MKRTLSILSHVHPISRKIDSESPYGSCHPDLLYRSSEFQFHQTYRTHLDYFRKFAVIVIVDVREVEPRPDI